MVTAEDFWIFFFKWPSIKLKTTKLSENDTHCPGFPSRLQYSHLAWTIQGLDCHEEEEDGKNEIGIRNSHSFGKERGSKDMLWK